MGVSSNFDFLAGQDERFARLGAMAERYFFDDAPSALIKLRQLGEFIAKDVAARHGLLPKYSVTFDEVLSTLKLKSLLPREVAELFFHLKRVGNAAAHEGAGTASEAFAALKIARTAWRSGFTGAMAARPTSSLDLLSPRPRQSMRRRNWSQSWRSYARVSAEVPTAKPRRSSPTKKLKPAD